MKSVWRIVVCLLVAGVMPVAAGEAARPRQGSSQTDPRKVLTEEQWRQVNRSVEQALAWLSTQQEDDGSFPTLSSGQPAVTSLVVLAYLSYGHLPDKGKYG